MKNGALSCMKLNLYLTPKANVTVTLDPNTHASKYKFFSLQTYVQSKNGSLSCVLEKLTLVYDTKSKCYRNHTS